MIVYSDDILIGATCQRELQKAIMILEHLLRIFDLNIDHSKTQAIRSHKDLPEKLNIIWDKSNCCWKEFTVLNRMKWLGFYL